MGNIIIPQLALPKLPLGTPLNPLQETAKGLAFWWRGIPGRKAFDESGHGNDGTINGPEWVGDGLLFDANSENVLISGNAGLTSTIPSTFVVICTFNSTTSFGALLVHRISGSVVFGMDQDDAGHLSYLWNNLFGFAGPTIPLNKTVLCAVTWSSQTEVTVTLVEDGKLTSATDIVSTQTIRAITEMRIGWDDSNAAFRHDGVISDVKIYNRALSPSELTDLYINPDLPMAQDPIWLRYSPEVSAGMAGIYYRNLLQGVT